MRGSRGGSERRRHPVLRRLLIGVVCLVLVVVGVAAVGLWKLHGNLTSINIDEVVGTERPTVSATTDAETDLLPLNILLVGSDTREKLTNADDFGGESEITKVDHSDTTILLHVAADRRSAYGISIPRDSMVHRPDCTPGATAQSQAEMPIGMFNAAYDDGGIGCTVKTVETNTGVYIDHYAVVNFEGFRDMVDALGGVDICVTQPVDDPTVGLKLPAGVSHLDGYQASQFVRARKSIGNGGDLGRIERQQAFLSALIREATDTGLLLKPTRLYGFLDAATKSVTMDPQLASLATLTDLARQVRDIKPSEIGFVTIPNRTYEPDPNRVEWTSEADAYWSAVKLDRPLPGTAPIEPSSTGTAPPAVLRVAPSAITVALINSSGATGLAKQAAEVLTAQGFVVSGYETGATVRDGVVIRYPAGGEDGAATLLAAFPGATTEQSTGGGTGYQVELGRGAPNVGEVPNRVGTTPLPAQTIVAPGIPGTPGAVPGPTATPRMADDTTCAQT